MHKSLLVMAIGLAGSAVLSGCNDGGTTVPPAATVTPSVAFETFVQIQTQQGTCETNLPAPTNNVDFTFASDQDEADPRDVSMVAPACSATSG